MRWATRVGGLFGIGLFIHWTFWLLIVWLSAASWLQGSTFGETLWGVALVLAIFACVVLHELGHALAARRFGVRTRDITLLPIGGVARLERIPEQPMQELAIALAGPAVNLVIAVALFAIIWVTQGVAAIGLWEWFGGDFLAKLMLANAFLVAFNLLPAFPMDGGRVLRALLATRMEHVRATQIAGAVGQAMADPVRGCRVLRELVPHVHRLVRLPGRATGIEIRPGEIALAECPGSRRNDHALSLARCE